VAGQAGELNRPPRIADHLIHNDAFLNGGCSWADAMEAGTTTTDAKSV
jgi:hypothetical protein